MMDLEELEDIKADIAEVFEEEGFDATYRELDRDDSNIDRELGILKTRRYTDVTVKAAYVFKVRMKKIDKDTAEFIPQKGGTVYLSSKLLEDASVVIRNQIGSLIIEQKEYEVKAVQYLPELLGTSVVNKILVEYLKPMEGTE